jgi:predicted transcriptional regulator
MEQLEAKPYTKLTTRETLNIVKEPVLTEHLSQVDRAIYGHNTAVVDSLKGLRTFADQQFARKIKEVKHGK